MKETEMYKVKENNLYMIDGFRYQLAKDFVIQIPIKLNHGIYDEYHTINRDGLLTLKRGFAWDGPSGPTINTKNSQIPAAVHDALYRMIRNDALPYSMKEVADQIFYEMLMHFGMSKFRAWIWWLGVHLFGKCSATKPSRVIEIVNVDDLYRKQK